MRRMLLVLLLPIGMSVQAFPDGGEKCEYDQEALLALDEQAFDQDMNGGWRAIANVPGCELAAVELIAAYRAKYPDTSSIVAWHQGQLLAQAGQNQQAIALMDSARKPPEEDIAGWDLYVNATIAFLSGDKQQLLAARDQLEDFPYPKLDGWPPLVDGYAEFPGPPGQTPVKVRWPPNLSVVEGFINCFDAPYKEAYAEGCRPKSP